MSFLHKTLDIVQEGNPSRTILARLDSGSESHEAMKLLECYGVSYVIKMRGTCSLSSTLFGVGPKAWRRVAFDGEGEVEVAEFSIERGSSSKPRRSVVLRKRDLDNLQGHLLDRSGWSKSFFVADRDWKPEDAAWFYDNRAGLERTISEAENDLSIDPVPTPSFGANAADLAIKVLARNLLVLHRDRGPRLGTRFRIATLRRRFIAIAGRLVRDTGPLVLRLSPHMPLRRIALVRASSRASTRPPRSPGHPHASSRSGTSRSSTTLEKSGLRVFENSRSCQGSRPGARSCEPPSPGAARIEL